MSIFFLHLKQIYRNIGRQRLYHSINIAGLLLGYYLIMWITVYVANEMSYDDFHEHAENTYRIAVKGTLSGEPFNFAVSSAPMGEVLKMKNLIENYTRIQQVEDVFLAYQNQKFYEEKLFFADSSFFEIFSLGTDSLSKDALKKPFSIVLTKSLAQKYFKNLNPIGKKLMWNNEQSYTVTGIIPDLPPNTHLEFSALASFSSLEFLPNASSMRYWGILNLYTFVIAQKNEIQKIEDFLYNVAQKKLGQESEDFQLEFIPYLQALSNIHLHSNLEFESGKVSKMENIYLFISIAALILVIVLINFVNLTTANIVVRSKEGAVRKILGATKSIIVEHYITEAVVLSLVALLVAMSIFEISIPFIQDFLNYRVYYQKIQTFPFGIFFIGLAVIIGVLAGIYPAIFLSRIPPLDGLKRTNLIKKAKKIRYRDILVLAQFTIAVVILTLAIIVGQQLRFVDKKHQSYDKNERIIVRFRNQDLKNQANLYKTKFKKIKGVHNVSLAESYPSGDFTANTYLFKTTDTISKSMLFYSFHVDEHFLKTMGYNILKGTNFEPNDSTNYKKIIVNQTLYDQTDWDVRLGEKIYKDDGENFEIIGVIDDFVFQSLKTKINPIVLHWLTQDPEYMIISLESENQDNTISNLRNTWAKMSKDFPFDYVYMNKNYTHFYENEQLIRKIMILLSVLAFLIAGVGLYGISVFITEQRTKEIGIRKVLGASTMEILKLFIQELTAWVFISIAIGWPLAWWLGHWWLDDFYYKIDIKIWFFLISGLIAIAVVWITIMVQTLKIIHKNAIDALRYE